MKLIPSLLPLLSRDYRYLNRYDIYMSYKKEISADEVPTCYGKEPSPKDGRSYPDYKESDVRIINLKRSNGLNTMAEAEVYVYAHYRFSKMIAKKTCRDGDLFSFKVVGHDTQNPDE